MDFQQNEGVENIQEMLDDLGIGEDGQNTQLFRKDSTMFIVDCNSSILSPFEDESQSQLQKILQGYANFMMSKIIANSGDKVGLILYNVKNNKNGLNFDCFYTVHELHNPSAQTIKQAGTIFKNFNLRTGGLTENKVSLHYVLWLYNNSIKDLPINKYHLRVFLFTSNDNPHPIGDQRRQQSIHYARQLAAKNVQIELFPVRNAKKCHFDIGKFYHQLISIDKEEINAAILDNSSKILDLQTRLRQKEFKKRTLNRLLMKIGNQTQIGVKIYSLFSKARKPIGKKVQAKSNKLLQKVSKQINNKGEILFDTQIGLYYGLGGQKIRIDKKDMNKIKSLEPIGISLIGFKPKTLIKPYHNIRSSYFLYPDEERVIGSSQFFDALINHLITFNLVGIAKLVPRMNQQLRFVGLLPQSESYDDQDHFQTPPGFNMIILPYADDIVNFTGNKTIIQPTEISIELLQVTKLLINNLTIPNFDFRNFQNPSLQKFYTHLQAHALNQKQVIQKSDLLEPDLQGFQKFIDVIDLVKQTTILDIQKIQCIKRQDESDIKIDQQSSQQEKKPIKKNIYNKKQFQKKSIKLKQVKQEQQIRSKENQEFNENIQSLICNGQIDSIKISELRQYLQNKKLDNKGKKQQLIDRILIYISFKNQI